MLLIKLRFYKLENTCLGKEKYSGSNMQIKVGTKNSKSKHCSQKGLVCKHTYINFYFDWLMQGEDNALRFETVKSVFSAVPSSIVFKKSVTYLIESPLKCTLQTTSQ